MNGIDLDKEMRKILMTATEETSISATASLVKLGFSARASFDMVEKIIVAKRDKSNES